MNSNRRTLLATGLMAAALSTGLAAQAAETLVYIGTYTGQGSMGIYLSNLDTDTGKLSAPTLVAETPNPTFLTLHTSGKYLYAANEVGEFQGKPGGAVSSYKINRSTGSLELINSQSAIGGGTCHVSVDKTGTSLFASNYGGGSAAGYALRADGGIEPSATFVQLKIDQVVSARQNASHAHSFNMHPGNQWGLLADLGADRVEVAELGSKPGEFHILKDAALKLKPGSGPRHTTFSSDGRNAYVINELNSTLSVFDVAAKVGTFSEVQTLSTLPPDFAGNNSTAEVVIHPNQKFVYGSNRGHHSIAIFARDTKTGKLTVVGHELTQGKTPRNFNIDPSGKFLIAANQDSANIVVFKIDPATGKLTPTGSTIQVDKAVCLKFISAK